MTENPKKPNIEVEKQKWEQIQSRCYVDMRREKIYHCPVCGDDYEPCKHWIPFEERGI